MVTLTSLVLRAAESSTHAAGSAPTCQPPSRPCSPLARGGLFSISQSDGLPERGPHHVDGYQAARLRPGPEPGTVRGRAGAPGDRLPDRFRRDLGRRWCWRRCSFSSSASSPSASAGLFIWLLPPGSVVWALVYFGLTLGGPRSATIGMRVMDLEMRTWYGTPAYFVLGAVHAVVFWFTVSVLHARSCCWCRFSTAAGGCCTISCSEP